MLVEITAVYRKRDVICLYYNIISHKHQGSARFVAQYRLDDYACCWIYSN
nr:MAG TPA: hypothetical protein [Caudoviricetes sp.]